MGDILKKAFALGLGITAVSRDVIQQFVDELVEKGEVAKSESKDVINRLIARGEEHQDELKGMVQEQVKKILADLNVATKQDLLDLEKKLTTSAEAVEIPPVVPPKL